MDPNAALRRFRAAKRAQDWDEAYEAAEALRTWIRGGGFHPQGMTPAEYAELKIQPPKTRKQRPRAPKLRTERIRVNRQGYDARGTYWGVGGPIYRVYSDDGLINSTVRASTAKEAKAKVTGNPCGVSNPRRKRPRPVHVWRGTANPNFHYPKTARGRPRKSRAFKLEFFASDGQTSLGSRKLKMPRQDAHAAATGYVGKKVRGKVVAKVVLTGPK